MLNKAKKSHQTLLAGKIIRGDGRGQALGFPTANLAIDLCQNLPPDGVYAGWARLENEAAWYRSAIHIGPRPVFPGATATCEVHLLDYTGGPLYNRRMEVYCRQYLRPVRAYPSVPELQQAIAEDVKNVRALMADEYRPPAG